MDGMRAICAAGALAVGGWLVGCGDDEDKKKSKSESAAKAAQVNKKGLPKAILPTCGVKQFPPKPQVRSVPTPDGGHVWSIGYTMDASRAAKLKPGASTSIVIIEYPPAGPAAAKGAKFQTIAGRRVAFSSPGKKQKVGAFTAQWKTDRARYTVLANGRDPSTIKGIIPCMP